MYDHTRQYCCTIIRGKSQKEMDDFLLQKYQDGKLQATPMTYRVDFSNIAVDSVITGLQREGA